MKETLFQKLQRVRIGDIGHIFLFLLACPAALIYRLFRRDLWLICDNKNEARDNGYWFFRYLREQHPEQDAVYAVSRRSPDYQKVRSLGKTVHYGSLRHWILYLTARVNISSQKGGKPNAAVCYALEVKGILRNTRVFLQHGIIKDDMDWLHYENTRMKRFVTSTEREYRFLCESGSLPQRNGNTAFYVKNSVIRTATLSKRGFAGLTSYSNSPSSPNNCLSCRPGGAGSPHRPQPRRKSKIFRISVRRPITGHGVPF